MSDGDGNRDFRAHVEMILRENAMSPKIIIIFRELKTIVEQHQQIGR